MSNGRVHVCSDSTNTKGKVEMVLLNLRGRLIDRCQLHFELRNLSKTECSEGNKVRRIFLLAAIVL